MGDGVRQVKDDFPTFFAKFCNEEKPLNLGSTTYCLIAIQTTKKMITIKIPLFF